MKQIVCEFSGWIKADIEDVKLTDSEGEVKTAKEWLKTRGNIHGLILEDLGDAYKVALDGDLVSLELSIEDD